LSLRGGTTIDTKSRHSSLLREVNERIREISLRWIQVPEPVEFVCECGDEDCVEVVALSISAYDAIRAEPGRFVVLANHETPRAHPSLQAAQA
jgi:hypothetical protein